MKLVSEERRSRMLQLYLYQLGDPNILAKVHLVECFSE